MVCHLISQSEKGHCAGLVAFEIRTGQFSLFRAKTVIMASGGLGRVYEPSTNALICTGDGMALAYRAGAPLMDMEMVQYHPTTLKGKGLLITEAARGEGAYLLNKDGDRFMKHYAPTMLELASRDVVSRAEQIEINEGRGINGCVLLDCRHLGRTILQERLGQIYAEAKTFANIDLAEEALPIRPGMHYQMGGIKTDTEGRCWDIHNQWKGLPGLLAAGETACVSLHGGNRLGANSLLDTIVFGRRAGQCAAEYARTIHSPTISEHLMENDQHLVRSLLAREGHGERAATLRLEMGTTMNRYVSVFREHEGLEKARQRIQELKARWPAVTIQNKGQVFNTGIIAILELGFMLDCAETIIEGACIRKESRGAHFRTDYLDRDDEEWLKHILLYHQPEESPHSDFLPVKITQWAPQIRVY